MDASSAPPRHGCLFGLSVAGAFLLLPALALLVILRACGGNDDWHFSAKVVEVRSTDICLELTSDGPGYLNNGCVPTVDVVGLPDDVRVGDCLRLTQQLHAELTFESRSSCSTP